MRARHEIETGRNDRESIVLTSSLSSLGGLVENCRGSQEKRIEGISDIRDESSREGVRVVIDLRGRYGWSF